METKLKTFLSQLHPLSLSSKPFGLKLYVTRQLEAIKPEIFLTFFFIFRRSSSQSQGKGGSASEPNRKTLQNANWGWEESKIFFSLCQPVCAGDFSFRLNLIRINYEAYEVNRRSVAATLRGVTEGFLLLLTIIDKRRVWFRASIKRQIKENLISTSRHIRTVKR